MESGWRKETAVPWASDWTYLSTHGRRAALREVRRGGGRRMRVERGRGRVRESSSGASGWVKARAVANGLMVMRHSQDDEEDARDEKTEDDGEEGAELHVEAGCGCKQARVNELPASPCATCSIRSPHSCRHPQPRHRRASASPAPERTHRATSRFSASQAA